ncbi:hypothetical protein A1O3_10295 [Capronia epimyces CBS 606.96]|uniref:Uncharacterized protein n=1 Tax=Capronia epimyces CBS 606.96 TaxID=1182542 RepID=W9X9J2_9EURO|nr:uncharacterized protein A1O3_10295 [Capronia epimyces CBS 606.96]EXJ77137.1 hypothetical protein A1O3_10295 [Capronia epimyces CBS 606.96]
MKGKQVVRQPDAQFSSKKLGGPSLIVEVAWTQSPKNLQKLAHDYILGTNEEVRTVIGVDVNTSRGKGARVSVWRPVYDKDKNAVGVGCDSTEIRSKDGVKNPDPKAGLRLTLEDFAYDRNPGQYPFLNSTNVFIPLDDLVSMLEESEEAQEDFKAEQPRRTSG